MYDYHVHSRLSFDGLDKAADIAAAAKKKGLKEICFTDHYDFNSDIGKKHFTFTPEKHKEIYDNLKVDGLVIKKGMELGLTRWNLDALEKFTEERPLDFVIGSIHYVDGYDPYDKRYWEGRTVQAAFTRYLEESIECVKLHPEFDVLGHINYVCKSPNSPTHEPLRYEDYREAADEIMKILAARGQGMEINTSGVDRVGEFLPSADFLRRFKQLGGEIVTVGSDAHDAARIGQYIDIAVDIVRDIFGYVCTFTERRPVFH